MISADDLLSLYMGIELQSLPLYVVAAMRTNSLRSSEAGLKYFLLGALSSGILLYGASLVYGVCGTTDFAGIAAAVSDGTLPVVFVVGMVFMVSGLAFKISAAPFHMWTPDVYEGSPTTVTALFAIAPKVAAMALMMRLTYGAFGAIADQWSQVLMALSIASMMVGALGAIMQTDIKRMMAYSSIAHMGYALAGLAAGTEAGAMGVIIYMTGYVFMGAGTFAIILLMRRDGQPATKITDLSGLSSTHPMLAIGLLVMMFSMAGIPPLAGFFGKWYVFLAAVEAGLIPLAVIGVVMSVVGAFYYLRIIQLMYFEDADAPLDADVPISNKLVLGVSMTVVLLLFAGLGSLLGSAETASIALMVAR
jgi:NADH-quinone oxidoreductase subunit N